DLTAQLEPFSDGVPDRVQDLSQIAADLVLDIDDDGDEVVVRVGGTSSKPLHRLRQRDTNGDLLGRDVKLLRGRFRTVTSDQRNRLRHAIAGAQARGQ